jgi:hypothetical protein
MPPTSQEQLQRREAIRDLLAKGPAATQAFLVRALEDRGFVATQSSVSRDLRELGAVKTPEGYELPTAGSADSSEVAAVAGGPAWSAQLPVTTRSSLPPNRRMPRKHSLHGSRK